MHLSKEERRADKDCLPWRGHVRKPVPDFIRKSILLFFGAVGYFIKKPFNSILKEKRRNVIGAVSASLS